MTFDKAKELALQLGIRFQLRSHKGHLLYRILLKYREAYQFYLINYIEFKKVLAFYNKNFEHLRSNRPRRNKTIRRISAYANNTLFSSTAYVDHLKRTKRSPSADICFKEQIAQTLSTLENEPLYNFMRALRNFSIHESPIKTAHVNSFTQDDAGKQVHTQFVLLRDRRDFEDSLEAKKRNNESKIANQYLKSLPDKVRLSDLIDQFHILISKSHKSLITSFVECHFSMLLKFSQADQRLREEEKYQKSEIPINEAQARHLKWLLQQQCNYLDISEG